MSADATKARQRRSRGRVSQKESGISEEGETEDMESVEEGVKKGVEETEGR